MADIIILAAGPKESSYYIWAGFSSLYMITVTAMQNGLYTSYFGGGALQTVKDYNIVFPYLYSEPDNVKSGLTIGAIPSIVFMGPLLLWFILGTFWDGAFSKGMSLMGTLSLVGMSFFSWIGSYIDDIYISDQANSIWYLSDAEAKAHVEAAKTDITVDG